MKFKRYGKNKRQLDTLLKNGAKVFKDDNDWTEVFKSLTRFEFRIDKHKKGLEITDLLGDTFIIETSEEIIIL